MDDVKNRKSNAGGNISKTLKELAELVSGNIIGDENVIISGVAGVDSAVDGQITFIASPKYAGQIAAGRASAVIASPDVKIPEGRNILHVKNPYLAFAKILELFNPPNPPYAGIHPRAAVHHTAKVGSSVSIYANVFIDEGAVIGDMVVLYPGVFIGRNAVICDGTMLYSNVSVREGCIIGKRVIAHCNAVIGSDGFGFARDGARHYKIPQTGIVRIEDDVEIGAGVTIDRATLGETVIGRGTKIDNLVQIGHNVTVGEDSIIVAQVGIAGSARLGKRVTLAGQAGINGHIEIGDDVVVAAQSGVTGDVAAKNVVAGMPAISHKEWLKAQNIFAKLPEIRKRLIDLENKVKEMEEGRHKA